MVGNFSVSVRCKDFGEQLKLAKYNLEANKMEFDEYKQKAQRILQVISFFASAFEILRVVIVFFFFVIFSVFCFSVEGKINCYAERRRRRCVVVERKHES